MFFQFTAKNNLDIHHFLKESLSRNDLLIKKDLKIDSRTYRKCN
jgi:hypothetical protein